MLGIADKMKGADEKRQVWNGHIKVQRVEMQPGQLLYLPACCIHAVETIEVFSYTYV